MGKELFQWGCAGEGDSLCKGRESCSFVFLTAHSCPGGL